MTEAERFSKPAFQVKQDQGEDRLPGEETVEPVGADIAQAGSRHPDQSPGHKNEYYYLQSKHRDNNTYPLIFCSRNAITSAVFIRVCSMLSRSRTVIVSSWSV